MVAGALWFYEHLDLVTRIRWVSRRPACVDNGLKVLHDLLADVAPLEYLSGDSLALLGEGKQQVFGSDVSVASVFGYRSGEDQDEVAPVASWHSAAGSRNEVSQNWSRRCSTTAARSVPGIGPGFTDRDDGPESGCQRGHGSGARCRLTRDPRGGRKSAVATRSARMSSRSSAQRKNSQVPAGWPTSSSWAHLAGSAAGQRQQPVRQQGVKPHLGRHR